MDTEKNSKKEEQEQILQSQIHVMKRAQKQYAEKPELDSPIDTCISH